MPNSVDLHLNLESLLQPTSRIKQMDSGERGENKQDWAAAAQAFFQLNELLGVGFAAALTQKQRN